jgi:hypothetical protein
MRRWLVVLALAVAVGHHVGVMFSSLGDVGSTGTRWADWIDILVPYVVVGAAALALSEVGTDRLGWVLFALGAIAYTQGHGIHLAANSVGNAVGGHVAHLWDEEVSHWFWYAGLSLMVTVLVRALPPLSAPASVWVVVGLAGFTWFTNTVEGGTPVLGLVVALTLGAYAARRRVVPVAAAYALSFVLLAVWGIWHHGFPQFSQLGWI